MDILPSGEFPPVKEKRKKDQTGVCFIGAGRIIDNFYAGTRFIAPGSSQACAEGRNESSLQTRRTGALTRKEITWGMFEQKRGESRSLGEGFLYTVVFFLTLSTCDRRISPAGPVRGLP